MNKEQAKVFWENVGLCVLFFLGGFCLLSILGRPSLTLTLGARLISGIFFLLMAAFFCVSFYFGWQAYQKGFSASAGKLKAGIEESLDGIQKMREKEVEIRKPQVPVEKHVYSSEDQRVTQTVERTKGNARKYHAKNH